MRLATPLLVAAVVAVGVAAAVDTVRGREEPDPRAEAVRQLREAGVRGRLVYVTRRCRVRAVSLPELRPARPPRGASFACSFSLSPDGRHVRPGDGAWDAESFEFAQCSGALAVDVRSRGRPFGVTFSGCPPAFRPRGGLTVAREEALVEVTMRCDRPPCEDVLLDRDELLAAAARHPNVPASLALVTLDVRDVDWLSSTRVALLLELRFLGNRDIGPQQVLAIYEGKRLVAVQPILFGPRAERLEAAPDGSHVAAEPSVVVRGDGSKVDLPRLPGTRALAWSPDGRRLAAATRAGVLVVDIGSGRRIRIPLMARDLAWR